MPPRARAAATNGATRPATPAATPAARAEDRVSAEQRLREPFAPSQVGKLPKITCAACSKAENRVCTNPRHAKSRCEVCQNFISASHIHLDYVGHAVVTNRLLDIDPDWTWEPFALDPNGLPMLDRAGGLWIRLTVLGRTRIGYGDITGKGGAKELIGDALRNAAMRFGVALDLWSKEDLTALSDDTQETQPGPATNGNGGGNGNGGPPASSRNWIAEAKRASTEQAVIDLGRAAHEAGEFDGAVKDFLVARRQQLAAAAREQA